MKLVYSHLQKFLPTLEVNPQQLRDDLTMIGHFTNFFENIEGEIVFDLDIKVNRGDCFGYYGIAKDLSVFYNIPLLTNILPEIVNQATEVLPIKVTTDNVQRILAVKFSQLQNTTSPPWLLKFTICHQIKSINLIVDLTNYVMFMYGIPSHAFDTQKSTDSLIWEMNPKYQEFTSLDGTKLTLNKDILMINNPDQPLSLSFWGGNNCAIDQNTSEIILEMAIYNPTVVRQNSRQLKSTTEAGTRLEKQLDPNLIPLAFNHLCKLILQNVGGQITSAFFDYYPQKATSPSIKFNPDKPSLVSGIKISPEFSLDCLTRLDCHIKDNQVTPPSIRPDITIEADLVEEVVRFWGYQKIPIDQPLSYKKITDITPKEIYLIDSLKDKLTDLGYDEMLSWPLVSKPTDSLSVVTTQNSINTESIYLRQSLIPSLKEQLNQHLRYKLSNSQFFEIGKIFFKEGDTYIEKNSLGIYHPNPDQLKKDLNYLSLPDNSKDSSFAEIIIESLEKIDYYQPKVIRQSAYELNSQLIILDANIVFDTIQDSAQLIKKYTQLIGVKYLWQIVITDIYQDTINKKYRYTFRVSYFNLDDKLAKEIHLKAFNLI
jgi:phenylalanyl-tRNA synthetase beta chain